MQGENKPSYGVYKPLIHARMSCVVSSNTHWDFTAIKKTHKQQV